MTVAVEFTSTGTVRVEKYGSYNHGEVAGFDAVTAAGLIKQGLAKPATPRPQQPQEIIREQPQVKIAVTLLKAYRNLNAGETAGFDKPEALELIARGIAKRAAPRGTHPLVAVALTIEDAAIQRLAQALDRLGHLEDREQQAAQLKADIAEIELVEAKAVAMGEALPTDLSDRKQQLVTLLVKVERDIELLETQHQPLLDDLAEAVRAHVRRKFAGIVSTNVAPVFKELTALVGKADRAYAALDLKGLEGLRVTAATAGMEPAELDLMLADAVGEFTGDALVSPVTGHVSLGDLPTVLHGIASGRQKVRV